MTRKEQSTWIMRRAWQLAKAGADRFGGKAREYMGQSIRQAWAMFRNMMASINPRDNTNDAPITIREMVVTVAEKLIGIASEIATAAVEFITPARAVRVRRFVDKVQSFFKLTAPPTMAIATASTGSGHHPPRIECPTT
ncbi:hypothetical protein [Rhizobium ruizarguesonis]|uniref:hypothetical protein n=1 Tax=Rhizobium ruizarguesonis TaxID=2081791 RepID=UPI00103229D2|nr:hypothetical protein [Rhizobium ruizarguesonis]TAV14739.1 hypothetical protein ELI34_04325 [Rhizobium ruizarguesonis]